MTAGATVGGTADATADATAGGTAVGRVCRAGTGKYRADSFDGYRGSGPDPIRPAGRTEREEQQGVH